MAIIKKYSVSASVWGKVSVNVYLDKIMADSQASAISRAVSTVCASGELSRRNCALLKEAAKRYDDKWGSVCEKIHGVMVHVCVCENTGE